METSGFSDTQLQVREAIAKICSDFPDVSIPSSNPGVNILIFDCRITGQLVMSRGNIPMNCTPLYPRMVGLALPYQKILADLD
jgi:hypothetical protein